MIRHSSTKKVKNVAINNLRGKIECGNCEFERIGDFDHYVIKKEILRMRGYFPDLQALLDMGECNYKKILAFFPEWREADSRSVEFLAESEAELKPGALFKVVQRAKYTTQLEISMKGHPLLGHPEKGIRILVKLYHDARVAEVVLPTKKEIMSGFYDYPNEKMFQVDEKMQSNHFLSECLAFCERFSQREKEGIGAVGDF